MLDLADLVIALKVCAGISPGTININADTNSGNRIGMADALYIIRVIAEIGRAHF